MSFLSMHPKSLVTGLAAVLALSFGTRSADAAPQGPISGVGAQAQAQSAQAQDNDWDAVLPTWGFSARTTGSSGNTAPAATPLNNLGGNGGGNSQPTGGADAPLAPQVTPANGKVPNVFGGGAGVPIPAIARPISVFLP